MSCSDANDEGDDEDTLGGTVVVAYSNSTRRVGGAAAWGIRVSHGGMVRAVLPCTLKLWEGGLSLRGRHELLGIVDNVNIRNDQLTLQVKTLLEVRQSR